MVLAITVSGVTVVFADSDTQIHLEFIGSDTVDLDQDQTTVMLKVIVDNYNPNIDEYFYSKIIDPDGQVVNDSKIILKYWENDLWHVTVGYKHDFKEIGDWTIVIHNESKSVFKSISFSVISPSNTPLFDTSSLSDVIPDGKTDSLQNILIVIVVEFVIFGVTMIIVLKKYEKKTPVEKPSKYLWYRIKVKPQIFEDDIFAEMLQNLKEFGLIILHYKDDLKIFAKVLPDESTHITSASDKGVDSELIDGPPKIPFTNVTVLKLKNSFRLPLTEEKQKIKIYSTSKDMPDFVIGVNGISCDPRKIQRSIEKYINSKTDKKWESGTSAMKKKAAAEKFFSCDIFYAGEIPSKVKAIINFTGHASPNSLVDGKKTTVEKILESVPSTSSFRNSCILTLEEVSSIIGLPDDSRDLSMEFGVDDTHVSGNAVVYKLDDNFEPVKE